MSIAFLMRANLSPPKAPLEATCAAHMHVYDDVHEVL